MIPLLVGTVLALGTLSFVLYPLLFAAPAQNRVPTAKYVVGDETNNAAIDALREIEFDRATGKLSESDYNALKTEYTQRAVNVMRAGGAPVCSVCGPRPERDAIYCSNCGRPLEV